MRILIISINCAPEATGFAPHTTPLAEHLTTKDHEVVVLAGFPFAPNWRRFGAYACSFIARETVIPSKLLFYMAAGRPILAAVNNRSQAAALIRAAGGGLIVTPEDPSGIAAGVQALRADEGECQRFGSRNREYAELHRDTILRAKEHVIELAFRNLAGAVSEARQ